MMQPLGRAPLPKPATPAPLISPNPVFANKLPQVPVTTTTKITEAAEKAAAESGIVGLSPALFAEGGALEWQLPADVNTTRTSSGLRFDFVGAIIPADADVPSYAGLHHHGIEADRVVNIYTSLINNFSLGWVYARGAASFGTKHSTSTTSCCFEYYCCDCRECKSWRIFR